MTHAGAGITINDPQTAGVKLQQLLADSTYATRAGDLAAVISAMTPPEESLDRLLQHLDLGVRSSPLP